MQPAPPVSALAACVLTLLTAGYAWVLALRGFRSRSVAQVDHSARRLKRVLLTSAVLAVVATVAGMLPVFSQVAAVSTPEKAIVLEQGLERLLLRPIGAGLLASLLGLTVLRARAGYLKGASPP